jgi:adenine phosphoribosyltransferase
LRVDKSIVDLKKYIRDIPDFPEPGILFRDITPLLKNPQAFNYTIDKLVDRFSQHSFDTVVAVESRGFLFGAPLASRMGKSLVLVRKPGKLPAATYSAQYSLEYGSDALEIHVDDIGPGERVVLLDDLLATGGTLQAAAQLVEVSGGLVTGIGLVIEMVDLGGRERLKDYDIFSLVQY